MRLIRYADDFVVMVAGTRDDAEALWDEVGSVVAPIGLRLSETKTRVCDIDEGFDFQRQPEIEMPVLEHPQRDDAEAETRSPIATSYTSPARLRGRWRRRRRRRRG